MAVYEDQSFTKVADKANSINVPDHIYVGVVGRNIGSRVVVAEDCWITPTNDANNPIRYDVLTGACADPNDAANIDLLENGASSQARFSFASFEFVNYENGQLFGHCNVVVCDPSIESCEPRCTGRKRRNATSQTTAQFTFAIEVNSSTSKNLKDCSSLPCTTL